MIEVYAPCRSREFLSGTLDEMGKGWERVFRHLKEAGVGVICDLEVVEMSLLDDEDMARLHGEFLGDATTTDVITFAHGELLIGVEVAARQAEQFGTNQSREIALYGIHGMLHLSGFDDQTPDEAKVMAARQEKLLANFFEGFEVE